jgi:hypothetical protein
MVAPRKGAFAEESAEVEVLFANMEKMKALTKKIQASKNRLETSGKTVQEAIRPVYGSTQKLQTTNRSMHRQYLSSYTRADMIFKTLTESWMRSTSCGRPSSTPTRRTASSSAV